MIFLFIDYDNNNFKILTQGNDIVTREIFLSLPPSLPPYSIFLCPSFPGPLPSFSPSLLLFPPSLT